MLRRKFLTFILMTSSALCFGTDQFLGQKDFDIYFGPNDPALDINYRRGKIVFKDDVYYDNFFCTQIAPQVLRTNNYIQNHVLGGLDCPMKQANEVNPYIHYLVRLTSISVLYEHLKKVHTSLYQLGEKEELCPIDYEDLFKRCRPRSSDMKKFVKRVEELFPQVFDWGRYPIFIHRKDYHLLSRSQGKDFVEMIQRDFPASSLRDSLAESCKRVKSEVLSLCSEVDSYYGLSNYPHISDYIQSTSAFSIANKYGSGAACFDSFTQVNKDRESIPQTVRNIFSINRDALKDVVSDGMYWYGALKEFDDMGLTLIEEKKPIIVAKVEPIKPIIKKPILKPVVDLEPEEIIAPPPKPKKIEKPKTKPVSAFLAATRQYIKTKKTTLVDMDRMRKDYRYSRKILKTLNGPLRPYQTRKALSDMKKFDKLGTAAKPLSFLFLRYMIDFKLHQGLYNVVAILGNNFYVVNDIDKQKEPVRISLRNDKHTNHKWRIWIKEVAQK
jgi:hypothetical protein